MRSKVINVTERDIKLGERRSLKSCPVALAICRTFKKSADTLRLAVTESVIRKGHNLMDINCTLIQNWIINFDSKDRLFNVKPFCFTLKY
jgi:hypothetical protein